MIDRQNIKPDKTKWLRTRKCGCGECRFYSQIERPECPKKDEPGAVMEQLWCMDLSLIGCKDYIDPLDFQPLPAFNENPEPIEETVNTIE